MLTWQVQRTTAKEKQEADARQVKPMLRHGRIKLHDVRDRKISGKEPDCAHDARALTYSASCGAVREGGEQNETQKGEIVRSERFTAALGAEAIVGTENSALHV